MYLCKRKANKFRNLATLIFLNIAILSCSFSPVNSDSEIIVNKELLNYPLRLRKWRHGDGMYPIGMTGSKKISQLFKDNKLSLIDKEKIWLLVDANNTIIWVVGLRQDRRFAVSETDKNRLKISLRS